MLRLTVVSDNRLKRKTHYAVEVTADWKYLLCRNLNSFGKYSTDDRETNCPRCLKIIKHKGLTFEREIYIDEEDSE